MKHKLISAVKHCKKRAAYIVIICLAMLPTISYSQPSPPGPGNNGGNPDTPLGVPFDGNMNMILLIAGIVFAVMIIRKLQKGKVNYN